MEFHGVIKQGLMEKEPAKIPTNAIFSVLRDYPLQQSYSPNLPNLFFLSLFVPKRAGFLHGKSLTPFERSFPKLRFKAMLA